MKNWIIGLVFVLLASPAFAVPADIEPISPGQYTPVADTTAQPLTPPPGATYAVVCVEGTSHRYTWDGTTTPTASVGALISAGSCVPFQGAEVIQAVKIIAVSAGGTFTVSYGK